MPAEQLSEEERAVRRTRVSSYQARIERSLTDFYTEVPQHSQATEDWRLIAVAHTRGHAVCELCGHNPIRRLFWIENRMTGDVRMIGSECARNYARVDLVDAYLTRVNQAVAAPRIEAQRQERARTREQQREAYRAQREAAQAERNSGRQAWRDANADVIAFLEGYTGDDTFVTSVARSLQQYTSLTDRQTSVIRDRMARMAASAVGETDEEGDNLVETTTTVAAPPAGPDDCPNVWNGVYTLAQAGRHQSYRIHTVQRGALEGKRIVKRLTTGGQWVGFGFLNRDGGLNLWRRFSGDADSPYVEWARNLLEVLATEAAQVNLRRGSAEFHIALDGRGIWAVNVSTYCRRCNRQLTTPTSVERGIGPECERRTADENRTTSLGSTDAVREDLTAREERIAEGARREREAARSSVNARRAAARQGQLAMCEVTGTEVR